MLKIEDHTEHSISLSLSSVIPLLDGNVIVLDNHLNCLAVNKAASLEFKKKFGIYFKVNQNILECLREFPEELIVIKESLSRAFGGEDFQTIVTFGKELQTEQYKLKLQRIMNGEGEVVAAIIIAKLLKEIQDRPTKTITPDNDSSVLELQFKKIANYMPQMVWLADHNGWNYWFNKKWHEYTGLSFEESEGWGWTKLLHPDHLEVQFENIRNALNNRKPWEQVSQFKGSNGKYRWFLSRANPIFNSQGKVDFWIGTHTDINAFKELENNYNQEKELLTYILNTIPVLITIYDPDTMEIFLNEFFVSTTGWTNKDVKEHNILDLVYPDKAYQIEVSDYMRSLSPGYKTFNMTKKNGATIETSWANIRLEDGRQVGIGIDLSEHNKMVKTILDANVKLKDQALKLKGYGDLAENLLYMAAHDLNNPIANLKMIVTMMEQPGSTTESNEYLHHMKSMISRLENVIRGIAEIIQAQRLNKENAVKINLQKLIEEVKSDLLFNQNKFDCSLQVSLENVKEIVYVKTFLESILKNLLSNAIKYRNTKKALVVNLTIRKEKEMILLSVADNGIGLDLNQAGKRLFQPFNRFSTQAEGTGIGLYIIKNFIEQNGGYITAEGEPGQGTTFNCYLKEYKSTTQTESRSID